MLTSNTRAVRPASRPAVERKSNSQRATQPALTRF